MLSNATTIQNLQNNEISSEPDTSEETIFPKLVVISMDYDGCFSIPNYNNNNQNNDISAQADFHPELFNHLMQCVTNVNQAIIMVGSNRQNAQLDNNGYGRIKTGSCFAPIRNIAQILNEKIASSKCSFDGLLLADIFHNRSAGETINLKEDYEKDKSKEIEDPQSELLYREKEITPEISGKLGLIYTQVQHIANLQKNLEIDFHFYDDDIRILEKINNYFLKFPHLLPKNVCLHLHEYQNGSQPGKGGPDWTKNNSPKNSFILKGVGEIHQNYKETIRNLPQDEKKVITIDPDKDIIELARPANSNLSLFPARTEALKVSNSTIPILTEYVEMTKIVAGGALLKGMETTAAAISITAAVGAAFSTTGASAGAVSALSAAAHGIMTGVGATLGIKMAAVMVGALGTYGAAAVATGGLLIAVTVAVTAIALIGYGIYRHTHIGDKKNTTTSSNSAVTAFAPKTDPSPSVSCPTSPDWFGGK